MHGLRSLQRCIGRAIQGEEGRAMLTAIGDDGLCAYARLRIYRHHYELSLAEALRAIYPVVCRLVDERFFAYAARCYIRATPPRRALLHEYGSSFPEFLAGFAPVRSLAYLADVARLERRINLSLHSPAAQAMDARAFHHVAPAAHPRLVFGLLPSLRYLESPWPVDRIWLANQEGADPAVDLTTGGTKLEIRQRDEEVIFGRLEPGEFELRRALQAGCTLEAAAETSLACHPQFDLAMGLKRLFTEGLIVSFDVQPREPVPAQGRLA